METSTFSYTKFSKFAVKSNQNLIEKHHVYATINLSYRFCILKIYNVFFKIITVHEQILYTIIEFYSSKNVNFMFAKWN